MEREERRRLERNIPLFLAWKATRSGLFWIPVFILFYQSFGLSYKEIMLLPVITGVVQLLLEVPSGVFADLVGRRHALFIGSALWTADFYPLLIAKGMTEIVISAILFGAALAFISGSDSAMLYDTLKALGREKEYKRISGRAFGYQCVGMAIGSLLGGPLTAQYGFAAPLIGAFGVGTLTTFLPVFMAEPPHYQELPDRQFFHHLKNAIRFTVRHPTVRRTTLYLGIFTGLMIVSHRLMQPSLIGVGLPVAWLGPVYFAWLLLSGAAALKAEWIERRIGERASLLLIPGLLLLAFLPLAFPHGWWIVALIASSEVAWGFTKPVIEEYVNRHVESHHRATVMSLGGFLMSVTIFLFAPLVGIVVDRFSLGMGFLLLSLLVGLAATFLLPGLLRGRESGGRSNAQSDGHGSGI